MAAPDRPVPRLSQRLQGQFELLSEPGSGPDLAGPIVLSATAPRQERGSMGNSMRLAAGGFAAIMAGGSIPLTAEDVAARWNKIVFPAEGVISARGAGYAAMIDKIEVTGPVVVFRLKRPTTAFLPALADPFAFIYRKAVLDKDPHWYEKNVLGSGPFKLEGYETGQAIKGVRNPDYYNSGLPYLDGFVD